MQSNLLTITMALKRQLLNNLLPFISARTSTK
jgi:hypothetical protein